LNPSIFRPEKNILTSICVRSFVNPRNVKRLEDLVNLKKTLFSTGMEPATFWLVA
jgi:hypothetical protein